jgi:hypothetical protein
MYYVLEAIFIGIFSLVLYFSLITIYKPIKDIPFLVLLFILGFIKHLFGYILGLQTAYCKKYKSPSANAVLPTLQDNLLEGIFFVILGSFLLIIIKKKYIIIFLIGFLLHIIFELSGLHRYFINTRCVYLY